MTFNNRAEFLAFYADNFAVGNEIEFKRTKVNKTTGIEETTTHVGTVVEKRKDQMNSDNFLIRFERDGQTIYNSFSVMQVTDVHILATN